MKTVIVAAALTVEQGKLLVTQRNKDSSHGLLWEFPGGKVKEGEDREASLISALVTAIPDVPIDWTILTVLASPVLTYMGVRTFDKWKLGK